MQPSPIIFPHVKMAAHRQGNYFAQFLTLHVIFLVMVSGIDACMTILITLYYNISKLPSKQFKDVTLDIALYILLLVFILQGKFPDKNTQEDGYAGVAPVDAFPAQNKFGETN